MILIITYDLRTPKDYHDFYEAIKAQGEEGKWWHYMASTWLLSTTKTPQQVSDAIHPHLAEQDLLFVCELNPNYQGWLPKPAWDWINSELKPPFDYLTAIASLGNPLVPPPRPPNALLEALSKIPPPPKPK
jgi:hypothetical protein